MSRNVVVKVEKRMIRRAGKDPSGMGHQLNHHGIGRVASCRDGGGEPHEIHPTAQKEIAPPCPPEGRRVFPTEPGIIGHEGKPGNRHGDHQIDSKRDGQAA